MIKRLIIFAFVLSCPAWAATFNCTTSGGTTTDFNTASTWTSCNSTFPQAPGANLYTYVITTGKTITCATGNTCDAGLNATPGATDCLVNQGGTLIVAAGATLNCEGLLGFQRGATLTASSSCGSLATININVPTSGVYGITNANAGSGAAIFTLTGTAPSSARCDVVINCNITGTGTCAYSTPSGNVTETWDYVQWKNFGSASVVAMSSAPSTPQDIHWHNIMCLNCGQVNATRTSATVNWSIDGAYLINPVVGSNLLTFTDSTAQSGGIRQFNRIRVYNEVNTNGVISINVRSAIVGESIEAGDPADIEGVVCYNCTISDIAASSASVRMNNSFIITDTVPNPTAPVSVLPDNGNTFWNIINFGIAGNYHVFAASGSSAAGSPTVLNHHICDGDGTAQNDFGDMELPIGGWKTYRAMNINNCGTTYSALTTTITSTVIDNSLMYRAQGASVCEIACAAGTSMTEFHNNVMVWPLDFIGTNFNTGAYGAGDGMHFNGAYIAASNQLTWGANTMGNNAYFMMPNSGDTLNGNAAQVNSGANSNNANVLAAPYINTIKGTAGGLTGVVNVTSTAGTDTTHLFCSTCNFTTAAVQAGSEVVGFTGAPNPRSYVTVVNSATEVTIGIAIPGMTVGTHFSIGPSIYSNASFFLGDANNLQGDTHINPSMRDPDNATVCYWMQVNGQTVHCGTRAAGFVYNSTSGPFQITSISGTTVINCTTCDFVTWNIQVGEPVVIYNTTLATIRGRSTVSIVNSATQLTIASVASLNAADHLIFLDVTRGAARALLTQANYDQTGAYTAMLPWATMMNLRSYLDWRLTPMNGQLKNASFSTNCAADNTLCDIGPVPTYPPAILSF